jgi:hypothetical protein
MTRPGRGIGNKPGPRRGCTIQAQIQIRLREPLSGCALERLQLCSSCAQPRCSIRRAAPRRAEYTICAAVAHDAVFTVYTYATTTEATRSG